MAWRQQSLGTVLIGGSPWRSLRRWQNLIRNTGEDFGVMYSTVVPDGSDLRSMDDTVVWSWNRVSGVSL